MSVLSFHTFFVLLHQFLGKKHRNHVNLSLSMQLAEVQQQNEWKKMPGVSEYEP